MLRRRSPSYPFRKPHDLSPEILQRVLDDEQKLAATRAKLAAEQIASQPSPDPSLTSAPLHNPSQTSQETAPMPQHPPELQNETKHDAATSAPSPEISPNSPQPQQKKSSNTRPAIAKNTKQYLRAAPKFLRGRPALARHSRKCQICRHPDRELIEDLYIHWHSANSILDFINSASDDDADPDQNENNITWIAIYRHAYALGLDEIRRRNLRFAFELLIEQAGDITPTSASIMAAARAYSCISDDGRWSDPPKHVIVTNITRHETHGEPVGALLVHPEERRAAPVADASPSAIPVRPHHPKNISCKPATNGSTPLCHTTSQLQDAESPGAPSGVSSARARSTTSNVIPPALRNEGNPAAPALLQQRKLNNDADGGEACPPRRGPAVSFIGAAHPASTREIRNPANLLKNKEKTFSNR